MPSQQYSFKVSDYAISKTGYILKATTLPPAIQPYFFVYVPFGRYNSVLMLDFLMATRKEVPALLQQQISQAVRDDLAGIENGIVIFGQEPNRPAELMQAAHATHDKRMAFFLRNMQAKMPERAGELTDLSVAKLSENSRKADHLFSTEASVNEHNREGYILLDAIGNRDDYGSSMFKDGLPGTILPKISESLQPLNELWAERPIDWDFNVFRSIFISNRVAVSDLERLQMKDLAFRVDNHDLLVDLQIEAAFRPYTPQGTIMRERFEAKRSNIFDLRVNTERLLGRRMFNWDGAVNRDYLLSSRIINWIGNVLSDREEGKRLFTWDAAPVTTRQMLAGRVNDPRTIVDYNRIKGARIGDNHPTSKVPNVFSADRDDAISEAIVHKDYHWAEIKTRQYKAHLAKEVQAQREAEVITRRFIDNIVGSRNINHAAHVIRERGEAERDISFQTYTLRIRQAARNVLKDCGFFVHSVATRKHDALLALERSVQGGMKNINRSAIRGGGALGSRNWDGRIYRHTTGSGKRSVDLALHLTSLEQAELNRKVVVQVIREFGQAQRNSADLYLSQNLEAGYGQIRKLQLSHDELASKSIELNTKLARSIISSKNPQQLAALARAIEGNRSSAIPVHLTDTLNSFKKEKDLYVSGGIAGAKVRQGGIPLAELTDSPTFANGIAIPRAGDMVEEFERFFSELREGDKWGILPEDLDVGIIDREFMSTILDVIFAWKGFFSDFFDPMMFADRLHDSHSLFDYALQWAKKERAAELMSPDFLVGARGRLDALMESKVVFATDQAHNGLLVFDVGFADRDKLRSALEAPVEELASGMEKPGHVEEGQRFDKERLSADLSEELLADDMLRPAIIQVQNPFGYFEPDPSYLGVHTEGEQSHRLTHFEEGKIAGKPQRPSELSAGDTGKQEGRPSERDDSKQGRLEKRISHYEEAIQGTEPIRPGDMLDTAEMDRSTKPSEVAAGLEGVRPDTCPALYAQEAFFAQQEERPAEHLERGSLGQQEKRPAQTDDGASGSQVSRAAAAEESMLAELQERLSYLASGYIFGEHQDRAGFIAEMYYEAARMSEHGSTLEDGLLGYMRLAFHQAFLEEHMFAVRPSEAAELFEDIVGRVEPFPAMLEEDKHAEPEAQPSYYHDALIADKREHYTELLSVITGTKEAAESIIEDYLAAVKKLKDSTFNQDLTATERIKQAFMEAIQTEGQGLVYDYNNDVLENGMDPEEWTGGYGVPEDYDPHDPSNPYYPWVEDLNTLELGQDDWIRFDNQSGTAWSRDKNQGLFICEQQLESLTGLYRNDFSHTDYMFEADFRVGAEQGDHAAGILFRYTNPQNYYMFVIHGGDVDGTLGMSRPMQLYKVVDGNQQQIGAPMNPFAWEKDKWYKFQVSVEGSRIKLSVSGRLQYDFTD
ncbi:hypothetical protein [Paenibacillus sp. P32E]|uniref:hypothetical protein n=1 Tax=Paenibacillus sp. P32E TaxID=1349434 RepID=UPI00093EB8ED|nr:hypothetical protein [Paenibacillus sp. P32E]OKP93675.1 hypothetical protein A3848_03980 [Paenibacillus sp. P32E]